MVRRPADNRFLKQGIVEWIDQFPATVKYRVLIIEEPRNQAFEGSFDSYLSEALTMLHKADMAVLSCSTVVHEGATVREFLVRRNGESDE